MHFDDLNKVIHLAHTENIQVSAASLYITPGALSKTLKKIEQQLNTRLFDRVGRNILLNNQGKKFVAYAVSLTHEYQQMCSEFTDKSIRYHMKLSGPAVLLPVGIEKITPFVSELNIELGINALYEGDAIKHVVSGQSNLAIVTNEALSNLAALSLKSIPLGTTHYQVIAGHQHAIFSKFPEGNIPIAEVLNYTFICPKTSPFCGVERGVGSDGWLDHKHPRKIAFKSDDFSALLAVVNQGAALAYVPDIIIDESKCRVLNIIGGLPPYKEKYALVYKPTTADGWLNKLISKL